MRVLIIEDERPAVAKLQAALRATEEALEVVGVCASVRESVEWLESHPHPDLILADIQLTDGTSFRVFERVPPSCPVVYVTAYDAHVLEAFAKNGIDYLLKPVKLEQLAAALGKYRALEAHFLREPEAPPAPRQRLVVRRGMDELSIPVEQVAWLTTEHKLSFLVDRQGRRFLVDAPLADLEASLDPSAFFRLNRRYIAHIDGIARFRSAGRGRLAVKLVPEAEEEVVVSQERATAFRTWIAG